MAVPLARGPLRPHPRAVSRRVPGESTGPPQDDPSPKDEAQRLRFIERELTHIRVRLDRILAAIKSDDLAPMPSVYDDGNEVEG